MEPLSSHLNGRKQTFDIDIKNNKYIDSRYDLIPTNEVGFTALEVATKLQDEKAIRFHIRTVKDIGIGKARELCSLTLEDVEIAETKGKPVRNPAALYNWKVQDYKNRRGNR